MRFLPAFNVRFISYMMGILLMIEALFMALAAGVSLLYNGNDLLAFIASIGIILGVGLIGFFAGRNHRDKKISRRDGVLLVAISWAIFSAFGMLPFLFSGAIPRVVDAYFETMSGFTTTGASILNNIEELPHGILFWRSAIQWVGGMGMIVFTLAILPMLQGNTSLIFEAEASGLTMSKFLPRTTQVANRLWGIYLGLTLILIGLLWAGPMNLYDAVCHAFTAMATGGYSTKQASIAHYNSPYIEYVLSAFMFIAAVNFTLIYFAVLRKWDEIRKDEELRAYTILTVVATLVVTVGLLYTGFYTDVEQTFRIALFQVTSIISSTGFASADYVPWGPFFWLVMLGLMFFCGCAGSTSGGMKMVRAVVISKVANNEFRKIAHPNAIFAIKLGDHALSQDIINKVLAFFVVFLAVISFAIVFACACGVPFDEAIGGVLTCISNVGPGLGSVGPAGNFAHMPDAVKWLYSFVMMTGRLEVFTVLALFLPSFWRS